MDDKPRSRWFIYMAYNREKAVTLRTTGMFSATFIYRSQP